MGVPGGIVKAAVPKPMVFRDCRFINVDYGHGSPVSRKIDRISVPSDIQAKWDALRVAGAEFRGECDKCVHSADGTYSRLACRNPLVVVPTIDPVRGELVYDERLCSDERGSLKSAHCGPLGKLFEPIPVQRYIGKWVLRVVFGAAATAPIWITALFL